MSFLPLTFEYGRGNHRIFCVMFGLMCFKIIQKNTCFNVIQGRKCFLRLALLKTSFMKKKTQFICWSNMDGFFIVLNSLCCKHFTANNSALKLTMLICISILITNIFGQDISREVQTLKDILCGVILNYKENFHTLP